LSDNEVLECDLVVIGAGMAGMTAAARAAEAGARVVVVEKAPQIGGSAALSGGYVWTATSKQQLDRHDNGDPALHAVVIEEYPEVMAWLRGRGIDMSPPVGALYGRGYQIDMMAHLRSCQSDIEKAGGFVVPGTKALSILKDDGRVAGVLTSHPDGDTELRAPHVLIATGGFQANPDMRARYIHPAARHMSLRSNNVSAGEGIELGIAAGGALAGPNTGYYGHLMARNAPLRGDSDFVRFTQYHSIHGVLLNRHGKRFVDESFDDHASSQITLRQPGATALLVWDDHAQRVHALLPPVAGAEALNRYQLAIDAGAPGGCFERMGDIAAFADGIGFDGAACVAGLQEYNHLMTVSPETASPLREQNARPLDRGPWYVLEVDSAITFSFCGLFTDDRARALDPFGEPIPGLFVAGADVGNAYRLGYGGGLALAATFAFRAMRTAGF
jgi:hypothetical protein